MNEVLVLKQASIRWRLSYLFGTLVLSLPGILWSFRTFVGTDLGVYWEIARRLRETGELALYKNYWDHKPPGIFFLLYPFTFLPSGNLDTLNIRIAVATIYALLASLLSWRLCRLSVILSQEQRTSNPLLPRIMKISLSGAIFTLIFFAIPIDSQANAVPLIASLVLEIISVITVIERRVGPLRSFVAGTMQSAAFIIRPTFSGFIASLVILILRREYFSIAKYLTGVFLVGGLVFLIWLALGTNVFYIGDSLYYFNREYVTHFKSITGVIAYLTQSDTALVIIGLSLVTSVSAISSIYVCRKRIHVGPAPMLKMFGPWFLYVTLAFLQAFAGRKIQSFYLFSLVVPTVSFAIFSLMLSRRLDLIRFGYVNALLLLSLSLLTWSNLKQWKEVEPNSFFTNRNMISGVVLSSASHCVTNDVKQSRLWVYGNRAHLYDLGRSAGLKPYDWTVYDTPLWWIDDERFTSWLAMFRSDPPEVIIRVNPRSLPLTKLKENWNERSLAIEQVIVESYRKADFPIPTESAWPYNHLYELFIKQSWCKLEGSTLDS